MELTNRHDANHVGCGPSSGSSFDLAVSAGAGPQRETARVISASRIGEQGKTDKPDSVAAPADQQAITDCKRFSTLRARLALAGYSLSRTDASDGAVTYYASRWGMTRVLNSLVEVAVFVAQVGIVL